MIRVSFLRVYVRTAPCAARDVYDRDISRRRRMSCTLRQRRGAEMKDSCDRNNTNNSNTNTNNNRIV